MKRKFLAKIVRWVDGDTVILDVDLGFRMTARLPFRLVGVNTPELRSQDSDEREAARAALEFVNAWLPAGSEVQVQTFKGKSFDRWLARVLYVDSKGVQRDIADQIIINGHGERYP